MNVIDALALARELHAGQVDKAGEPYIWHPVRVMMRLPSGSSDDAKIAALLHDTIEDCGVSGAALVARGVPLAAVQIVELLTRSPAQGYEQFIRVIARFGGDPSAVKRADIEDNTDPGRMAAFARIAPAKAALLGARYREALRVLGGCSARGGAT